MRDSATNPKHYNRYKIEPWDFIAENGIGYFEGNVIKYVCRWKEKNGVEDLKKARAYLDRLIENTEREHERIRKMDTLRKSERERWITAIAVLFIGACIVALACGLFSGCASVSQDVTTMDGDSFHQNGFAFLSKQDIAQKSSAEFYPNNSGAVIGLNTNSAQDSTQVIEALKAVIALGQALSTTGMFGGGQAPESPQSNATPLGRLNDALAQINAMRAQVDALRGLYGDVLPNRDKVPVGP